MPTGTSPIGQEYVKATRGERYTPNPREQELIAYVQGQLEAGEYAKGPEIRDSALALAFYMNRQRVRWRPTTGQSGYLDDMEPEEWESDLVHNRIRPTVEAQVAKLTENRPALTVLPATDDEDDLSAARMSEKLLEWVWYDRKMLKRTREFVQAMLIFGTAWFKVWWDRDAGEIIEEGAAESPEVPHDILTELADQRTDLPLDMDGTPRDAAMAALLGEGRFVETPSELAQDVLGPMDEALRSSDIQLRRPGKRTGAMRVSVLTGFEVGMDPGARDEEDARWIYHLASLHRDEVTLRWSNGRFAKADHALKGEPWTARYFAQLRAEAKVRDRAMEDRVQVIEYFERPSLRHPDGLYIVFGGGVLLDYREELPTGDFPFVSARHLPVPGRHRGEGTVKDLLEAQKELNEQLRAMVHTSRLMSDPKWLVAKGSVTEGAITGGKSGEIVEYDPTLPPPRSVPAPPFSPIHGVIMQDQVQAMKDLSMVGDIVFGQIPSGMSGRAIGFWQDQMASTLGPTVREIEAALEDVGSKALKHYRDFAPAEMLLRVAGRNNRIEVVRFKASDIRSTDVRIQPNSMLPRHINYRREQILMLGAQGFLNLQDPDEKSRALRAMEFGDLEAALGTHDGDRSYAREENAMLESVGGPGWDGTMPAPSADEDHRLHIQELRTLRTSDVYRKMDGRGQQAVLWHQAWHYYYEAMVSSGSPWWLLPPATFPQMPPQPTPPGQPIPEPAGGVARGPVPDAFGPNPPELPPEPSGLPPEPYGMPPEAMAAMMSPSADLQRAFASDRPHGPGVGDFETLGE